MENLASTEYSSTDESYSVSNSLLRLAEFLYQYVLLVGAKLFLIGLTIGIFVVLKKAMPRVGRWETISMDGDRYVDEEYAQRRLPESKAKTIIYRIDFFWVGLTTVTLPLFAFITCIILSIMFDYESVTRTHCGVSNAASSLIQ